MRADQTTGPNLPDQPSAGTVPVAQLHWPKRIYVNDEGGHNNASIHDADTGEQLLDVVDVRARITREGGELDVVRWNYGAVPKGEQPPTESYTYPIRKLDITAGGPRGA